MHTFIDIENILHAAELGNKSKLRDEFGEVVWVMNELFQEKMLLQHPKILEGWPEGDIQRQLETAPKIQILIKKVIIVIWLS